MIIIKKIDFIEVEGDIGQIHKQLSSAERMVRVFDSSIDATIMIEQRELIESIRGRRFRNPRNGQDVVIGMSQQAEALLGIQYEAWDNMQRECELTVIAVEERHYVREATLQARVDELMRPWYVKLWSKIRG